MDLVLMTNKDYGLPFLGFSGELSGHRSLKTRKTIREHLEDINAAKDHQTTKTSFEMFWLAKKTPIDDTQVAKHVYM